MKTEIRKLTGFKDKNGREISDGDQVVFLHNYGTVSGCVNLVGLVKWSDSWNCFIVANVRDEQGRDLCDRFLSDILSKVEVK